MLTVVLIVFAAIMLIGVLFLVLRSGNNPRHNKAGEAAVNQQQQSVPKVNRAMGSGDD